MRDRHHALYPRALWDATNLGASLRSIPALIPRIDREVHEELHRNVSMIPPLEHHMAKNVLRMMEMSRPSSHFAAIDTFMSAVEDAAEHPKATELDRRLGELIVASMDAQKPYIELGLPTNTKIFDLGRAA